MCTKATIENVKTWKSGDSYVHVLWICATLCFLISIASFLFDLTNPLLRIKFNNVNENYMDICVVVRISCTPSWNFHEIQRCWWRFTSRQCLKSIFQYNESSVQLLFIFYRWNEAKITITAGYEYTGWVGKNCSFLFPLLGFFSAVFLSSIVHRIRSWPSRTYSVAKPLSLAENWLNFPNFSHCYLPSAATVAADLTING